MRNISMAMNRKVSIFDMEFEVSSVSVGLLDYSHSSGKSLIRIVGPNITMEFAATNHDINNNTHLMNLLSVKKKQTRDLKDYDVMIHCSGNVTAALLLDNEEEKAYLGISVRNELDDPDASVGIKLATNRALGLERKLPLRLLSPDKVKAVNTFIENNCCGFPVEGL